jgi:hypothetical protein
MKKMNVNIAIRVIIAIGIPAILLGAYYAYTVNH